MLTREKLLARVSLALAAGSVLMFGDTVRLLAEWRINVLSGIFLLDACVLGAVVFAYVAREAKDHSPLSITQPHGMR